MSQPAATTREMDLVTMQVVDWEGPIVEILSRRPLATRTLRHARAGAREPPRPAAHGALRAGLQRGMQHLR